MRSFTHLKHPTGASILGFTLIGFLSLAIASCKSPNEGTRRTETNLDPGWPRGEKLFHQVSYESVGTKIPTIEGAEFVNDDEICATCHGAYAKAFAQNVHRGDTCESCHGPASRHVETRGKEPGLVFGFKTGDPIARAEACLKCHEENQCTEGSRWRTSKHAQCGTTCVDCHRGHYNVPPGTPATTEPGADASPTDRAAKLAGYADTAKAGSPIGPGYVKPKKSLPSLRGTTNHLGAVAPGICYRCHTGMQDYQKIAGPHQICGPNGFTARRATILTGRLLKKPKGPLLEVPQRGADDGMAIRRRTASMAWPAPTATIRTRPRECRKSWASPMATARTCFARSGR